MTRARALALALLLGVARPSAAQLAEPMQIRNLNPLVAIFGLPAWDTVTSGNRFGASLELANHFEFATVGGESLALDGETARTTLSFAHGFDGGWMIGAELPLFHIGGGVLDDAIDAWHSTFNLPDGGRNQRPEGQLRFVLGHSGAVFFRLDEPQSGIGDLQLKVARGLGADNGFVIEAGVKLGTGDEQMLAGSGSTDEWLTLLRTRPLPERRHPAGYYWGIGVVHAGDPVAIEFPAETWVYTAIVGGSWQRWPKFGLKAQLDVHGPFYDSPLEQIGVTAVELTFGAWMNRADRARLEFALVEDVRVNTAPDVVLKMAAHWSW
ncbi:MAG TPA: DUF3187 family protein [Gammaproteobacteria bacterium]|nr:DUF3187 family protein [Gammaproteobacteria bacterium]